MVVVSTYPTDTLDGTDFVLGTNAAGAVKRFPASEFASGGGATPGGSDTEIQFNDGGDALDGDPNFTWVPADGLTVKKHVAFGNYGVIDSVTFAAGDPVNESTDSSNYALVLNDYNSGDLGTLGAGTPFSLYPSFKHTGAGDSTAFGFDSEPVINSDSTGSWSYFAAGNLQPINYGSGNVYSLVGAFAQPWHNGSGVANQLIGFQASISATGDVTTGYGLRVDTAAGGGDYTNLYGIHVADQSGIGSGDSLNIKSVGGGNLFTGHVAVGNSAILDTYIFAPDDPINESVSAATSTLAIVEHVVLTVDQQVTGFLSSTGFKADVDIGFLSSADFQTSINSDSVGNYGTVNAFNQYLANYGSGDFNVIFGFRGQVEHYGPGSIDYIICHQGLNWVDPASGGVTNSIAVHADSYGPGQNVVNQYGLYVEDQSGIGSVISDNIRSKGASSLNVFEGALNVMGGVPQLDKGTITSGTVTFNLSTGGTKQKLTVGGALTVAFSGWPASGRYGEIEIDLVDGSAFTVTWPTVNWFVGDGTKSTTFAAMGVTLETSGHNSVMVWTYDGGTTLYGTAG